MIRRLVPHWLALQILGRDPWDAGDWTLDEALTIELIAESIALEQRVAAAMKQARR